jgi:hypothetical protein
MHYFNLHFSYYFDNLNLYDKKHSTSSNLTLAGIFYFADRGKFSFYDLSFFSFNRSSLSGLWNGASVSSYISFALYLEALYFNPFGFLVAAAQCYVILSFFFPSFVSIYQQYNRFFVLGQYIFGVLFIGFGLVRIWAFVTANAYLLQYFYDFHKTFSLMRWLQT